MRDHVSRVARTCFFHLRRLRSLRRQLGRDVTARLVSALVLSRLDCCNAILVACRSTADQHEWSSICDCICDHVTPALLELHWLPIAERIDFKLYVCWFTRHLLGMHHSALRTLSGQWLICHPKPHCGQHIVAICMCHEHVEGSETERLPLRPHACGIVYLLTSNFTGRRQHLSNAVLELFYLTGASLNICKWLCNALPVF